MLRKDAVSVKVKYWLSSPDRRFQSIIWLLTGLLYYPVFRALYSSRWESVDYTHAYFILPVALYLGWHALKSNPLPPQSAVTPHGPSIMFAGLFVFGLLTFIFGWRQGYMSLYTFSLLPVLYGLIGSLYGPRTARLLWFPIAYLLLLVPPPMGILDSVTLPMRYGVSFVTEHLVRLVGYPITREGLLLSIGGHEVFLGEACSGFRSLITLSSLGLAYIFLSKNGKPRQLLMTASIIPLALLGNLLRVSSVVIVTYYCGETWGQKFFHDASGLVMFVVMILGLLAIENFKVPVQKTPVARAQ